MKDVKNEFEAAKNRVQGLAAALNEAIARDVADAERHVSRFGNDGPNWSHVADLAYVGDKLREILGFLGK